MGKFFTTVSSLWVLFIPLLSVTKVGLIDSIDDCNDNPFENDRETIILLKQLGELKDYGLITEQEFNAKKKLLLKV